MRATLDAGPVQIVRRDGIAAIVAEVAFQTGLRRVDILSRGRTAPLVRARAAIVWLASDLTNASTTVIGRALEGRDHSTIITARRKGDDLRQRDPAFRRLTDRLRDHFRDQQED